MTLERFKAILADCDMPVWLAPALPATLFVIGAAVRVAIIAWARFDGLYGQDSFAYLQYGRQVLATFPGRVSPETFYWPLGYPALAAILMRLTGPGPLGPQLASVLTGSAVAPLLYLLVLELQPNGERNASVAVSAGLIALGCGQLIHSSIVVMADAAGCCWATLSALALLRWRGRSSLGAVGWLLAAAASLGAAVVTRWIYLALILPFGLYTALVLGQKWMSARPARDWIAVAIAGLLFAGIVGPQFQFSQQSAAPVLSHSWVTHWSLGNAARFSVDNPDGHFEYSAPPALFYAEPLFHPYYFLPVLTPLLVLGAWRLRRRPEGWLLIGWVAVVYFYLIGLPYENFRFGLALYPPLPILAATGLPRQRANWTLAMAAACAFVSPLFVSRGLAPLFELKKNELAAARYLQDRLPPSSTVLTFGLTLTLQHYTDLAAVDLSELPQDSLHTTVCKGQPVYAFLQAANLETQWVGLLPELNFRRLRDVEGFAPVGRILDWELFRPSRPCPPPR